jgi:hypothetical protein
MCVYVNKHIGPTVTNVPNNPNFITHKNIPFFQMYCTLPTNTTNSSGRTLASLIIRLQYTPWLPLSIAISLQFLFAWHVDRPRLHLSTSSKDMSLLLPPPVWPYIIAFAVLSLLILHMWPRHPILIEFMNLDNIFSFHQFFYVTIFPNPPWVTLPDRSKYPSYDPPFEYCKGIHIIYC